MVKILLITILTLGFMGCSSKKEEDKKIEKTKTEQKISTTKKTVSDDW